MDKKAKEYILQFMRLTLFQLHPDFHNYPIRDMKNQRYSKGEEFDGTPYETSDNLQQAFFMNDAIEQLEKIKQ